VDSPLAFIITGFDARKHSCSDKHNSDNSRIAHQTYKMWRHLMDITDTDDQKSCCHYQFNYYQRRLKLLMGWL